jgi:hypothetical protein
VSIHILRPLFALLAAFVLGLGATACGGDDAEVEEGNGAADVTEESLPVSFDFEDGTDGWGPSSDGVTIESSTRQAHSGDASMEVVTPGEGPDEGALMNHGRSGPRVLVEPGGTYTATAWVRAPAGSQMNFIIRERTATGDSVGTTSVNVEPSGDWQRVSATRRFTSGERITVEFRPAATQNITFEVDDVEIREDRAPGDGAGNQDGGEENEGGGE